MKRLFCGDLYQPESETGLEQGSCIRSVKVLSHAGHGVKKRWQFNLLGLVEVVSALIQVASSVFIWKIFVCCLHEAHMCGV